MEVTRQVLVKLIHYLTNMNRADRNNNPGNIKVPSGGLEQAKQMYGDSGLSIDPSPATDGGSFLKFSTPQSGQNAQITLLKNPSYQSLSVDKAMRRWSGGGYGGDVAPSLASRNMSDLNPDELNQLATSMSKREGYTGNKLLGSETDASPMQPIQDNTQSVKPQLTHEQLVGNINAMEQQGASQQEVQTYLDSLKTSGASSDNTVQPTDTTQPQFFGSQTSTPTSDNQDPNLGTELGNRVSQASSAISNTWSGKINPLSGLIQGVGAVAGGINDIAQKGLELIPGVKTAEGWLSQGVQSLAQTDAGKSVVNQIGLFAQAHPEMADDIGALGNIAGVVLLATGAGKAVSFAVDSVGKVVGEDAAETIAKDVATQATKDVAGTVKEGILGRIKQAVSEDMLKTGQTIEKVVPNFTKIGTYTEKITALQNAIAKGGISNEERVILENAIQAIKPQAMGEIGTSAFAANHPIISGTANRVGGMIKGAVTHPLRTALESTGIGTIGYGAYKGLLGK